MKIDSKTLSPCIRQCCLNEQDICIGCFRHVDEIVGWNKLSDEQKRNILIKCKQREIAEK